MNNQINLETSQTPEIPQTLSFGASSGLSLEENFDFGETKQTIVHIRVQQRNGRKMWTIVENLRDCVGGDRKKLEYLFDKLKKTFHCGGVLTEDPNLGLVVTLQGDHRAGVLDFLVKNEIVEKENIKMHGS